MMALDARSLTLKIGDGQDPETFTELGGLQNHRITLRNDAASFHHNNITHSWNESLAQTGRQQLTLSGRGIFTDSTSEELLRAQAFGNHVKNYQVILGNGDVLDGGFTIRNFERQADMDGAIEYQLSLESAGKITFTSPS